ncbi:diacylglycerol/lipid kinase family protein [Streptomyces sp. C10-9-1]|uniref:diacylglycerol/lipid kinase family protein n=1 Tax=Streptomyces sp. C10-9-1 TaxID=1859285 RepID=UPI003D730D2A
MGLETTERVHRAQRWAARASLAAAALAALLPLWFGGATGVLLLLAGAAGLAVTAAALWWALSRRGLVRAAAAVLAVAAPLSVMVLVVSTRLLWVVVASSALWALALATGRYALRSTGLRPARPREYRTARPRRPVILMNPRSGGGKVGRHGLKERAEQLGARVVLLDADRHVDVAALARQAVREGADLLGVAGGDGTQALVAAVAAEHRVPLLVVSAGTRNHFAMDLGLDREDPASCLEALSDGVELDVDLGFAGDRPFVNNVSFGAYGAVVQSPAYREDKVGTALELLPDLLSRRRGPRLTVRAGAAVLREPQAVLVSNNPYRTDDPLGLGRRERVNGGVLGVLGLRVDSAAEAAALLLAPEREGFTVLTARTVVVEADAAELEAGIDGEAAILAAPVHCRIARHALRVRVPRHRPGVPGVPPRFEWRRLRKLAAAVGRTAVTGYDVPRRERAGRGAGPGA